MISSSESNIELNEKRISQHLQDLIDAANNTVGTIKEQILEIYHQAVKEGFTPHQAKLLIKERVLAKAAPSYIYKVLPEESKRAYISQEKNENLKNISNSESDHFVENLQESNQKEVKNLKSLIGDNVENPQETEQNTEIITDPYQLQDAESIGEEVKDISESEPEQQLPPQEADDSKSRDQILVTYEIQKLRTELNEARQIINQQAEKIEQLSIKQIKTFGHKFTFPFDFESPDGTIVPVLVTAFPDKQTGYVIFDKKRGANQ